jgi:hypothetical protein
VLLYVSTERFSQTLAPLTIYYRPDLLRFLRFVPYEHLDVLKELGKGVVIWTDFDRLDRKALEKAGKIHSILAARGVLQLNSPSESLGRFDLLRRLAETGTSIAWTRRPGSNNFPHSFEMSPALPESGRNSTTAPTNSSGRSPDFGPRGTSQGNR